MAKRKTRNSKKKVKRTRLRLGRVFLLLVILIGVIFGGTKLYLSSASKAVDPSSKKSIIVEIKEGSSVKQVAKVLKDNSLIKSKLVFVENVKDLGKAGSLKAGKYKLSQNMDNSSIINKMAKGEIYQDGIKVTIPEGSISTDIVNTLVKKGLGNRDVYKKLFRDPSQFKGEFDFLNNSKITTLEGFLYPQTYYFKKGTSEKEIFTTMIKEFEKVYNKSVKSLADKNKYSFYDVVIMASIVEKEAVNDEDRDIIAGIFYNRLSKNMKLQSDAVLQYGLPERKSRVLFSDLKVETPYNLYLNAGLPPTPVASPGIKSLVAAANPKKTDYLYFVTNKDGKNSYSKTFDEHKVNADKYRKEMYGSESTSSSGDTTTESSSESTKSTTDKSGSSQETDSSSSSNQTIEEVE